MLLRLVHGSVHDRAVGWFQAVDLFQLVAFAFSLAEATADCWNWNLNWPCVVSWMVGTRIGVGIVMAEVLFADARLVRIADHPNCFADHYCNLVLPHSPSSACHLTDSLPFFFVAIAYIKKYKSLPCQKEITRNKTKQNNKAKPFLK